jgi:hypothetical protein
MARSAISCSDAVLRARPRDVIPAGTRCLGTAAAGHRRQVTYRGKRLYLFAGDYGLQRERQ